MRYKAVKTQLGTTFQGDRLTGNGPLSDQAILSFDISQVTSDLTFSLFLTRNGPLS